LMDIYKTSYYLNLYLITFSQPALSSAQMADFEQSQ
jgi:hypothetical protein